MLSTYTPSVNAIYEFQGPPTGSLPDGAGFAMHEDLGKQFVDGLETTGTRDSIIYNPGVSGNDRKMTVERKYCIRRNWQLICFPSVPIRESAHKHFS